MKAILREIKYNESYKDENIREEPIFRLKFPATLCFQDSNRNELYLYNGNFYSIFYNTINAIKNFDKLSVEELQDIIDSTKQNIGKFFNVNLYRISVNEITNGKFNGLAVCNYYEEKCHIIHEYKIASYKTRRDVVRELQFRICKRAIDLEIVFFDEKNNKVEISNDINGISVFIPEIVVPQMEEIVYKIYHMYYEDNVLNDTIFSDLLAKMYAIFRKVQSTIYKGYQILGNPY